MTRRVDTTGLVTPGFKTAKLIHLGEINLHRLFFFPGELCFPSLITLYWTKWCAMVNKMSEGSQQNRGEKTERLLRPALVSQVLASWRTLLTAFITSLPVWEQTRCLYFLSSSWIHMMAHLLAIIISFKVVHLLTLLWPLVCPTRPYQWLKSVGLLTFLQLLNLAII